MQHYATVITCGIICTPRVSSIHDSLMSLIYESQIFRSQATMSQIFGKFSLNFRTFLYNVSLFLLSTKTYKPYKQEFYIVLILYPCVLPAFNNLHSNSLNLITFDIP